MLPAGEALEGVDERGGAVNGGVEGGVERVGLGAVADGDGVALASDRGLVEVREAQRGDVEALDVLVQEVGVGVVVQRGQGAGVHDEVLGAVHELEALGLVGLLVDGVDQHVIGVGPGATLDLEVVAEVGDVDVIGRDVGMGALAELGVVVAGARGPHVEHADGVGVVHDPAVTGDGEVASLAGVQEGRPLLVLHAHLDADASQRGLQVLADGLVALVGVVEVRHRREVGEHAGALVVGVVLLQDLDGLVEVGLESVLPDVIVAGAVAAASVLHEVGAVGLADALAHEGAGGDLVGLGDVDADVGAVEQQADGTTDLGTRLLGFLGAQAGSAGGSATVGGAAAARGEAADEDDGTDALEEVPAGKIGHSILPFVYTCKTHRHAVHRSNLFP